MAATVLVPTKNINREEWLQWRKKGIGGSDVAAIAGLNPWRSPIAVYLDKIGDIQEDEQNEAMYWGSVLEDVVASEFTKRTGLKIQRRNAILQHPEHPFMLANLDRIIIDKEKSNGILEVKTSGINMKALWEGDRLPDYVALQVHHYLAVTGYGYAYVAVLIGGREYKHQLIERDQEVIDYLVKIESDFWRLVESRTPPEVDGSESSTEVLSLLYKNPKPESEIALPPTAFDYIQAFEAAQAEEKAAADRKDAAANKLKSMLGDNEIGVLGDRRVSWKQVYSNRLDSKTLKADLPSIYQKYCRESISRRFAVK